MTTRMNGERVRGALTELSLVFAGLVLGIFVLMIVQGVGLFGDVSEFIGGPLITAIAATFYAFAGRRVIREPEPLARPDDSASTGRITSVTLLCIAAALGGSLLLGELLELVGVPVQEQPRIVEIVEAARSGEDRRTIVVLGVSAVVLAPIVEEWLFRGLLFRRLMAHAARPFAYTASALGFAAIHNNPAGFVIYFWLGLVFAVAIDRTNKLGASIAVHVANNTFAFALLLFGEQ